MISRNWRRGGMENWSFSLLALYRWAVGFVNGILFQIGTNCFAHEVQAEAWW
jgi:hypothetical protein